MKLEQTKANKYILYLQQFAIDLSEQRTVIQLHCK